MVDGIRGILAVEQIPDLLNGDGLLLLELIAKRPTLVGVALESTAVQTPRGFANHADLALGVEIPLHQDTSRNGPVRTDLHHSRTRVGDRSDLVMVDGIRGVLAIELVPDLLNADGLLLLELIAQRPPLVGVALESTAVQAPRGFANHPEPLGCKDRAVFHRDRDGDRRGATEDLTEPILGADIGMVGKEVARVGVDSDDRAGKRSPYRHHGGIQNRI